MGQVKASAGKCDFEKSKATGMVQYQIDKSLESEQKLKNQIKEIKETNLEIGHMYTQKKQALSTNKKRMDTWKFRANSRLKLLSELKLDNNKANDGRRVKNLMM